jgi:PAS domain S-box-containing protein
VLWASLTASIFRDAQGAFLSTFAIIIDITDRKKAEIALRESEAKLKAVLDETPVAINLSDAAGNIEYVNAQFRALFGYSAEEIPTTQQWLLHAYPDPTYRAWVLSGRQEAIDRTRRVGVDTMPRELKITDKDGTTRWVTAAIAQAADKTITIFHDITGRKRAEEALKESNVKLEQSLNSTIEAIGVVSERRDPFTAGHQKRVAVLAVALADEMSLTKDQVRCVQVAALLHDVGKVNVPGEILSKPGILSAVEFKVVTTYPEASYEILKTTAYPWPVAEVVLQHQERLNGSGYPRGLVGKDIMIEARILAVADVVEAMTAHRPYRTALTIETALEELAQNKGILFDPAVVDACARLFRDRGFAFGRDQNKVPAQAR